jgi:hypothetical protein
MPPVIETRPAEIMSADAKPLPVEVRKCTTEELRERLSGWDQVRRLLRPSLAATLTNCEKLAGSAAQKLRQADIRLMA